VIPELEELLMPDWLSTISEGSPFPDLTKVLVDSLYYPASGLNGTPVKYLAGNTHSFVFADYGIMKDEFLKNLNGKAPECGFRYYHSICQREISRREIVPDGWEPTIVPTAREGRERLLETERNCTPFGHWSVWERDANADADVGPQRFSFFFLAGEMSAIYQGLYCRLQISPKFLAIIQPGAMGGEWESVTSNGSFFKKVVSSNKGRGTKYGLPQYLVYGGFGRGLYDHPCWEEYEGERIVQLPERYAGVWRRASQDGA
jgi:hypothetical protein